MIYDRMEPLTPIRDPTVVNNGLSSMKPMIENQHYARTPLRVKVPSATSANPEYALSTVMTTAIMIIRHQTRTRSKDAKQRTHVRPSNSRG